MCIGRKVLENTGNQAVLIIIIIVFEPKPLANRVLIAKVLLGGAFADDHGKRFFQGGCRIARYHGHPKEGKEAGAGIEKLSVLKLDGLTRLLLIGDHHIIFRAHVIQVSPTCYFGELCQHIRTNSRIVFGTMKYLLTILIDVQADTVNTVGILLVAIKARFEGDIMQYEQGTGNTDGQARNVNQRVHLVFHQGAQGYFEII